MPHRVFVIAAIRIWAELLRDRMALAARFDVVGATADGDAAIHDIDRLVAPPDMVVLDVNTPSANTTAATLRGRDARTRLVAVGLESDPAQVLSWVMAGAKGLVARTASVDELLRMLTSVTTGGTPCSPVLMDALLRAVARGAQQRGATDGLTDRQYQVAELLAEGLTNKEIASRLQIESGTVKAHVHSIIQKLGISRRAQVAARLHREGVTASAIRFDVRSGPAGSRLFHK